MLISFLLPAAIPAALDMAPGRLLGWLIAGGAALAAAERGRVARGAHDAGRRAPRHCNFGSRTACGGGQRPRGRLLSQAA